MARYGSHRGCGLAGRIAVSDETERRILDISFKQCSLGRLGLACTGVRIDSSSSMSRGIEYSRRAEKQSGGRWHDVITRAATGCSPLDRSFCLRSFTPVCKAKAGQLSQRMTENAET